MKLNNAIKKLEKAGYVIFGSECESGNITAIGSGMLSQITFYVYDSGDISKPYVESVTASLQDRHTDLMTGTFAANLKQAMSWIA